MEKTATLNLRVSPQVKQEAETVLNQLGIPMSVAVSAYLKQIALTGGIPFPVALPHSPAYSLQRLNQEALEYAVAEGMSEYKAGKAVDAETAFAEFNRNHQK